jgi:LysM repeat protein
MASGAAMMALGAVPLAVTVHSGDTLSGIAASHGQSLGSVEAANPQIHNPDLIYVGEQVNLSGTGVASTGHASGTDGDGDHDGDQSDAVSTPAPVRPSSAVSAPSSGGSDLADVPGVPRSFAACVALRESSNGTNQAYNGGVYGIITASGINVNGQSLAAQKAAFSKLYGLYGTQPWSPSDGCH